MLASKFTRANGAMFYYRVQPDKQDGFALTWWIEATDGETTMAEVEATASEQEAQEKACIAAERHGFANLFRAS